MSRTTDRTAYRLAGLCATLATLHFAKPQPFDDLIPRAMPGPPRLWTYASGVAEYATAGLLLHPLTRPLGGRAATALFVAVFPGNVQMAWNWRRKPWYLQAISLGRLPMQAQLIRQSESVYRGD